MVVAVARIGIVLVVILGVAFACQTKRLNDLQWKVAAQTLPKGSGWAPAKPTAPSIPGVPRRTILATVEGRVRYLPAPPRPSVPCDLASVDAEINCRVEVVTGGGRLATWGVLRGFDQERVLPKRWAGEVELPPGPGNRHLEEEGAAPMDTPTTESAPPVIHVAVQQRALLWEGRVEYVIPTKAIRLSATRMLTRHIGIAASATAPLNQGGEFDAGAGLAIRF